MSILQDQLIESGYELLRDRHITETELSKHTVPGYISRKNIRGTQSCYLLFRDKYSRLTSIYLSGERLRLCEESIKNHDVAILQLTANGDIRNFEIIDTQQARSIYRIHV